ncbi:hypothetical protein [Streptomyces sp. NBC_01235]|uniref:hypothetical protein n=1 Tax=Streptomyces sp. NBC_01235 TaxID=2903788 RepID=UPI002E14A869|nr:hypothetical protein OG289_17405 [Streptomyces sp. NBC_01235]
MRHTGRVVSEVDADILLTVEAEDRLTLERFNTQVPAAGALDRQPYPYVLLIDGDDSRAIDIGILGRHPITPVPPHLFDTAPESPDKRLFSRDCPASPKLRTDKYGSDYARPPGEGLRAWTTKDGYKNGFRYVVCAGYRPDGEKLTGDVTSPVSFGR